MRGKLSSPQITLLVEMLGVVVCCASLATARDANAGVVVEPPAYCLYLQAAFQIAHVFDSVKDQGPTARIFYFFSVGDHFRVASEGLSTCG